jgi:nucleotide-binding universal stress UspA family protein
MAVKDILVCIDPTDAGLTRLRLAATLAREHGAHLSAAYIQSRHDEALTRDAVGLTTTTPGSGAPERTLVWGMPFSDEGEAAHSPIVAEMLETRFRDILREHPVTADWHQLAAGDSAELIGMLRTIDLAIVGQVSPGYAVPSGFRPGDLVMATGRPLLVVPYAGSYETTGRRVLIAWDGTREAARAVHDAIPLITQAELAVVMTVRSDNASGDHDTRGIERVVRNLERHGIRARAEEAAQSDIPVADVLLSRASDIDADLIVAGAYHHSQLREALLGGVSRELLDHMTTPVLMSH